MPQNRIERDEPAPISALGSAEVPYVAPEVQNIVERTAAEEFRSLSKAEKRARLVNVLDRGLVNSRLYVELPSELHGEWVSKDPVEIARMQAMGFEIDTQYAKKNAINKTGEGYNAMGDVIFMTAPIEVKEIIEELRLQKYLEMNGPPNRGKNTQQAEEKEVISNASLPTITESSESSVNRDQIAAALFNKE